VIAAASTPAGPAAKAATATIPIVFVTGSDPVADGLVGSLARPGGNLTGVTGLGVELVQKQVEVLHELVPAGRLIGGVINPTSPTAEAMSGSLQRTARALGLQIRILHAATEREIDTAFATLSQLRVGGLVIAPDVFFTTRIEHLGALALQHRMPAIYLFRQFAIAGGLMSYGSSLSELYRLLGVYVGRILKGERPEDLPVQQATKVELIINMKTAKALGLTIPLPLLGRADEVIE
jgi:putative tryptophan/tyrosine transport system substrate-binding protein